MRLFAMFAAATALRVTATPASITNDMTADRLIATCKLPHRMTKDELFTCIKIYAGIRDYDDAKYYLLQNQTYDARELNVMIDAIKRQHNATVKGNTSNPLFHGAPAGHPHLHQNGTLKPPAHMY